MTSLLPIIKDVIPIIMPAAVQVTKSSEIQESTSQTEGMIRKGAIVDKSDKLCASGTTHLVLTSPLSSSRQPSAFTFFHLLPYLYPPDLEAFFSLGKTQACEAHCITSYEHVVFISHSCMQSHGTSVRTPAEPEEQDTIVFASSGHGAIVSNNGKDRQELAPGDFALIPAWVEHQEVNDGEEDVTWIITRSGREPVVVNLEGWGGKVEK
ncbi:hypothetical protein G7Y89_g7459 [Cudoniella acicularis]|uniref:Cupin type-2 domain-containing protein n=1 Tax=Cudoniella acicularis TaxID=354080 RepID=A0A8H4RK26_9HELO|nr:hypothetical protein G7Y89_g7459 [Cudoniella acicularis]